MRLKPLLTHDLQDLAAAPASSLPLASTAASQQDALPSRIVLDGFSSRCHMGLEAGPKCSKNCRCGKQKAIYFSYRKKKKVSYPESFESLNP